MSSPSFTKPIVCFAACLGASAVTVAVISSLTAVAPPRFPGSGYNDVMTSPAERLESLAAALPRRRPRPDLAAVEALAARTGIRAPERTAVVVGTNGKTSTATFLARLLQAGGLRVGLTVSPHLRSWSERVLVDGKEVDEGELADRVETLAEAAADLDARFFDLLTLAAVAIFADRGVD